MGWSSERSGKRGSSDVMRAQTRTVLFLPLSSTCLAAGLQVAPRRLAPAGGLPLWRRHSIIPEADSDQGAAERVSGGHLRSHCSRGRSLPCPGRIQGNTAPSHATMRNEDPGAGLEPRGDLSCTLRRRRGGARGGGPGDVVRFAPLHLQPATGRPTERHTRLYPFDLQEQLDEISPKPGQVLLTREGGLTVLAPSTMPAVGDPVEWVVQWRASECRDQKSETIPSAVYRVTVTFASPEVAEEVQEDSVVGRRFPKDVDVRVFSPISQSS